MKIAHIILLLLACLLTSCGRQPTPSPAPAPTPPTAAATPATHPKPATLKYNIDGTLIEAPADKPITIRKTTDENSGGGFEKHEGNASGKGAGLVSQFEKAVINFNASAPIANILGFGGSSGGTTDIAGTFTGKAGTPIMAWLGGLLFFGGVAAFCFKRIRDGIILCVCGLVAFGASLIGPAGWLVIIVLFLGVAAYFWFVGQKAHRATEAVWGLAATVEALPEPERKSFKAAAKSLNHIEEPDAKFIRNLKKAKGLPSER